MHQHEQATAQSVVDGDNRRSRARIVDVAAAAGVSPKTVSRVVNDEKGVLPETRDRVRAVVAELGYVPDSSARSLKSGGTDTIGIMVDAIADPFFAAFVSTIEELAVARGMNVVFASTGYDTTLETAQLARLVGHRLVGLIVTPTGVSAEELALLRRSLPIVCVDRAREGIDSVVVDDFGATVEATEAFIALGHRRIGFIGEETGYTTVFRRFEGFKAALAAAGIELDDTLVVDHVRPHDKSTLAADTLLGLDNPPTAVFCSSSPASIGMVEAIRASGHTQPAMISFGDFQLAAALTPAITCVDQDPVTIGSTTFERLLELIDDPHADPQRIVVPTHLVRRGSGELTPEQVHKGEIR